MSGSSRVFARFLAALRIRTFGRFSNGENLNDARLSILHNQSDEERSAARNKNVDFAGVALTAAGFLFALIVFISESIGNNFVGLHIHYLYVTLVLCMLGIAIGLLYLWQNSMSWWHSFIGGVSLFLLYYGLIFFIVVIFTRSMSLKIRIVVWVFFGVVLIVAITFNRCKSRPSVSQGPVNGTGNASSSRDTSTQDLESQASERRHPASQASPRLNAASPDSEFQDTERPHDGQTNQGVETDDEKLDSVINALSSRSTQSFPPHNLVPSTQDCINIVTQFPGFEEGTNRYFQALRFFLKKEARENFMVPTNNEAKMGFLTYMMEQ